MIIVTGFLVTVAICSRMRPPQLSSLVSTTTTPVAVMNAAVFPPPPLIT
jgi:hypothetical protein